MIPLAAALYCLAVYGQAYTCPLTHDGCLDLRAARMHAGLSDGACLPIGAHPAQQRRAPPMPTRWHIRPWAENPGFGVPR